MKWKITAFVTLLAIILTIIFFNFNSPLSSKIHNNVEKYATMLSKISDSKDAYSEIQPSQEEIINLINTQAKNESEEDALNQLSSLYTLYVRAIAEYETGGISDDTVKQFNKITDYLNETYNMNIE